MHDTADVRNIIDSRIATSNEIEGQECSTCRRLLAWHFYRKDSSWKNGRRPQCIDCEDQPWLSSSEHLSRMSEMNFNSEGTKKQRFRFQLDYMDDEPRTGWPMHSSDFIRKLRCVVPRDKIFLTDGNFLGDIAIYKISGVRRSDYDGPRGDFKYLFYLPIGWMKEFSTYQFDNRAIPVREKERGWRTVLLKLIRGKVLTEDQANWEFGKASGIGSTVYNRSLYEYRNQVTL